jgi:hypothetical protein
VSFKAGTLTFSSTHTRRSKALVCAGVAGFGALLLSQMAVDPTTITVVYMGVVVLVIVGALIGLVRAFRIGIEVDDRGMTARTTYTTKRFAWAEIAEAQAVDRAIRSSGRNLVPMTQQARSRIQVVPVLRLVSGRRVRLLGLQVQIEADAFSTNWLDDAVTEINERLEERRGALGSGASPATPS